MLSFRIHQRNAESTGFVLLTESMAMMAETFDAREATRIVAGVLIAAGGVAPAAVESANRVLARVSLGPLRDQDFLAATPEELAPRIPPQLRGPLVDLLFEVAGEEPLRRRIALSYATIWQIDRVARPSEPPAASRGIGQRALRAIVGQLPRHQVGSVVTEEERNVQQENQVYRSNGVETRQAAHVVDPLRARIHRVRAEMMQVIAAVDRVVIGKHDAVTRTLMAMAARGHVLLVDAPGVGKTLLCKTIAGALGARFGRVQLTPDLMPMDVTGATIYDAKSGAFVFKPGPVFTNILLADEINRATPKTQSALLEVMEERTVTVDGTTHRMADPFQVLATMNPLDHDGTFALPAAQIDRFMMMLELGHPSIDDEVRVLDTHLASSGHGEPPGPVVSVEQFIEWQRTVPLVHASPEVKRAAAVYVDGLRRMAPNGNIVSPRSTLAWMRAAQARAILMGREFVIVEDLIDVAAEIFRHRLWITAPEIRDRLQAIHMQQPGAQR